MTVSWCQTGALKTTECSAVTLGIALLYFMAKAIGIITEIKAIPALLSQSSDFLGVGGGCRRVLGQVRKEGGTVVSEH